MRKLLTICFLGILLSFTPVNSGFAAAIPEVSGVPNVAGGRTSYKPEIKAPQGSKHFRRKSQKLGKTTNARRYGGGGRRSRNSRNKGGGRVKSKVYNPPAQRTSNFANN